VTSMTTFGGDLFLFCFSEISVHGSTCRVPVASKPSMSFQKALSNNVIGQTRAFR